MKKRPTVFQAMTLDHLCKGCELIDTDNRIYWNCHCGPVSIFPNTIECCIPKLKRYQMGWLEKYGWAVKIDISASPFSQWKITDLGREIYAKYRASMP